MFVDILQYLIVSMERVRSNYPLINVKLRSNFFGKDYLVTEFIA